MGKLLTNVPPYRTCLLHLPSLLWLQAGPSRARHVGFFFFASCLGLTTAYICALYRLKMHAMHLQSGYTAPGRWPRLDASLPMRRLRRLPRERLEQQLKFLTDRFAQPYWQYAIQGSHGAPTVGHCPATASPYLGLRRAPSIRTEAS